MTAQQVEDLTALNTRFVEADDNHMWLSCQIGRWVTVRTKVSTHRAITEQVFRLICFGSSWDVAYKMFLNRQA